MPVQAMMQKGEAPASVQCAALRALGQVLGTIESMPLSDAKIFNECVLWRASSSCLQATQNSVAALSKMCLAYFRESFPW